MSKSLCRKAARCMAKHGTSWSGFRNGPGPSFPWPVSCLRLDHVSNDHPELAGDAVARREVSARLATLQALLEAELYRWHLTMRCGFAKNHQPKCLRQADLNSIAFRVG